MSLIRKGNFECAQGGTRTRTSLPTEDFKSSMSTIPSPGQIFSYINKFLNVKKFVMREMLDLVTRSSFVSTRNRRPRDPHSNPQKNKQLFFETRVGFEPTNDGFANRSVKPLRHRVLFYFLISFNIF